MTMKTPRLVAVAVALATLGGVASAQQPASGASASETPLPATRPAGYAVGSDGRPVLSGFGTCVRSSFWALANSVDPCDQITRVSVPVPVVAYEQKPAPPPPPVAVVTPPPQPRTVIQKMTLSADVLFDFNKAELKDEGKRKLDELAGQIKDAKVEEIVVVGHADRIASEGYNQKLSEQRAEAVKTYLSGQGAQTSVITAQGKGEAQPVTGDQCKKLGPERANNKKLVECLQPDRRVEIEVLGSREVAVSPGAPAAGGTQAPATGGTR
jgi:OmpA-OmpF porin, OOP family